MKILAATQVVASPTQAVAVPTLAVAMAAATVAATTVAAVTVVAATAVLVLLPQFPLSPPWLRLRKKLLLSHLHQLLIRVLGLLSPARLLVQASFASP
ncbi:hypothetical protein [Bythopirellula goksoeyrii]|uniref:hypothetical protein n=1 Tax=Bythopirellula goksoeyrii TaxID=1400387 RepID=UPI00143D1774|nr:hypothetical protein [Bythopirellula goksoeyrii]